MGIIIIPGQDPEPDPEPESTFTIARDELQAWLRRLIAANKSVRRDHRSQESVDRAVEDCFEEDEIELAALINLCSSFRVAGCEHLALGVLMQLCADLSAAGHFDRQC